MFGRWRAIEAHMARHAELLEEIREENRLGREQYLRLEKRAEERDRRNEAAFKENQAAFHENQAAFHATRDSLRAIVLELREHREILQDIRHGIQANTEGLLRVLDELRRDDEGPSPAGA